VRTRAIQISSGCCKLPSAHRRNFATANTGPIPVWVRCPCLASGAAKILLCTTLTVLLVAKLRFL